MLTRVQRQPTKPPIILIYGVPKFGKSTFGAHADKPVFLQTEDGTGNIDVPAFPLAKSYSEVMSNLTELATEEHDFKTCVIDSLDWFEPLIHKQVCQEKKVSSIEEIPYGKGYYMALDMWREYIDAVKYLRDERDMAIVEIGHSEIKRFEDPSNAAYDRYQLKLHKSASDLIFESADVIIFGNYRVNVTKEKQGFSERSRALGGDRALFTEERPGFKAGNRFDLPEIIPFTKDGAYWNIIKSHIPYYKQQGEK